MDSATSVGLLRLFDRFRFLAAEQAVSSTVRLAGCALCFTLHAPIEAYLAAWAAGTVTAFVYVNSVACGTSIAAKLLKDFTFRGPLSEGLPGVWRFAWATNFSGTIDTAFSQVITLVVGSVLGPAQAAMWRVGRQVADGMAKPAKLLVPALYPELAKMRATGGEAAMRKLSRPDRPDRRGGGRGAAAGLDPVRRDVLTLVMGKPFAAGAGIMNWQVAAAAIGVLAMPLEPMLVSLGKAGLALRVRAVVCAVYLAALVPLIRGRGPERGRRGPGRRRRRPGDRHVSGLRRSLAAETARPKATNKLAPKVKTAPKASRNDYSDVLLANREIRRFPHPDGRARLRRDRRNRDQPLFAARRAGRGPALRQAARAGLDLAPRLLATGAKPGDSVGLIADTEADFVRAFFACQYAGLVPAPLPLPAPLGGREAYVEQIARMLGSAHAKLLIGPAGMKDWVAEIAAKAPLDFAGVLADLPEARATPCPTASPDNTCYLQFSSGSTRFPTGVLVTHRALMANAVAITRDGLQVRPTDRAVSWLPLYHDMGLIGFLLSPHDQPDVGRPAAHRGLRAPAAAVAGPDHQERRHHLLQPDLRLRAVRPPGRGGLDRAPGPVQVAQRRPGRRHDPHRPAARLRRAVRQPSASRTRPSWPATAWPRRPWPCRWPRWAAA
jgi:hypothetical protein